MDDKIERPQPFSRAANEIQPPSPRMKSVVTVLMIVALCAGALAQGPASSSKMSAAIAGIVVKDPDGQPVKKALIELIAENQTEGGDYTAVTGADGLFRIENVLPGRYRLFAERTGFLDGEKHGGRSEGRVLTLTAGQEVKDLQIRLQAAAAIRGRVTDEDGDPLAGAEVTVLRRTFASGHRHWEQAGAERTNDLGEYRVAGLAPGDVYVSVSPPPDFRALIETGGAAAGETRKSDQSATTYQTTYYPSTTDRSQAAPIQLHAGDDFPADFSLIPGPSLSIRGAVVNLPPQSSATIMLQSRDFSLIQNGAEMHRDGSFVIKDVSPGSYTIVASVDGAPVPMTARQSLQIGSTSVDGLRLAPQPGASVRGRLRLESRGGVRFDPGQIFLTLQKVEGDDDSGAFTIGDRFENLTHVAADGSFGWKDVPAGNYYVQLIGENGANRDWFVKSVMAGGRELSDSGIDVNGGTVGLDVVVSANGGIADGVVVDSKGQPVADAVVVAVPEVRLRGRIDRYRNTTTDQSGHFTLRGIRPGEYTLFAWESVDGDAYYSPEFLKSYEGQGSALHVSEGERKEMQVNVIPDGQEQ